MIRREVPVEEERRKNQKEIAKAEDIKVFDGPNREGQKKGREGEEEEKGKKF